MRAACLALAVAATAAATPACAASLLEKNFWLSGPNYDGALPVCGDPGVADTIAARFASKEAEYWRPALAIQAIDRQRQIAYRPWGRNYIPRRFCEARVLTTDGRYRTVSYVIGEDFGPIGATWGVEWCVSGTDHNYAYAPNCKMARP